MISAIVSIALQTGHLWLYRSGWVGVENGSRNKVLCVSWWVSLWCVCVWQQSDISNHQQLAGVNPPATDALFYALVTVPMSAFRQSCLLNTTQADGASKMLSKWFQLTFIWKERAYRKGESHHCAFELTHWHNTLPLSSHVSWVIHCPFQSHWRKSLAWIRRSRRSFLV